MSFHWFEKELRLISPDLRLVRDPGRLGWDLWIVERKVPAHIHAECLKQAGEAGIERFKDITLEDGRVIHYDLVPEWTIGHIVRDYNFDLGDPQAYREPQRRDLDSIRRWLFEYKNAEEQIRQMQNERTEREIQVKADGRRETARNVVMKYGRKPHTVDFAANKGKRVTIRRKRMSTTASKT